MGPFLYIYSQSIQTHLSDLAAVCRPEVIKISGRISHHPVLLPIGALVSYVFNIYSKKTHNYLNMVSATV